MTRLTLVVYPDGRTFIVTEKPLTMQAASELREAWMSATEGSLTIVPEATVKLMEANFVDGGIVVAKPFTNTWGEVVEPHQRRDCPTCGGSGFYKLPYGCLDDPDMECEDEDNCYCDCH